MKRRQPEKATHCMISTIRHSGRGKTVETLNRPMVVRDWRREEEEAEHREFLGQ